MLRVRRADIVGIGRIGCEQGLVGVDVHPPGEANRRIRNQLQHLCTEEVGPAVAGGTKAKADVVANIVGGHGLQGKTMGDALFELADIWHGQPLIQFRLPEQHHLNQFFVAGFQIRQQANHLQRFDRHRVGFIDQCHYPPAIAMEFDQPPLQRAHNLAAGEPLSGDVRIGGNGDQQVVRRHEWYRRVACQNRFRQALHQYPAQHGLAGADFTGHFDDAFAARHRVDQRFQGRATIGTGKKEFGVRGNFERRFTQAKMFKVHRHRCCRPQKLIPAAKCSTGT